MLGGSPKQRFYSKVGDLAPVHQSWRHFRVERHGNHPARPGGLEPPTSGFGDLRSTN